MELIGVGEAFVSLLDVKARPAVVERAYILPPAGRIGSATAEEREPLIAGRGLGVVYDKPTDCECRSNNGSTIAREIVRGVPRSLLGGRRR